MNGGPLFRKLAMPVLSLGIFALALAGTPCPNPLSYTINDGYCPALPFYMGGGYTGVVAPSAQDGGCIEPGNSAEKCKVWSAAVNAQQKKVINQYTNRFGYLVWANCVNDTPLTMMGVKHGTSTGETCDYCRKE